MACHELPPDRQFVDFIDVLPQHLLRRTARNTPFCPRNAAKKHPFSFTIHYSLFTIHSMPAPTLIAFDLDGTLANTEVLGIPSVLELLREEYGITLTEEHWRATYHGMAGQQLLDRINIAHGSNLQWTDFAPRRYARLQKAFQQYGIEPCAGVLQVIRTLAARGQKMAVVSNSSPQRIALTLNVLNGQRAVGVALEKIFKNHIFGASDPAYPTRKTKPAPDVYLAALGHYNLKGKQCLAIEDSPTGVQSATAAGIPCWGYLGLSTQPASDGAKLTHAGAKKLLHHWDDFLPALARFKPTKA
jgi:beta-phosphoglucomutase-like phosphatase (HAD superfamily)